MTRAMAYYRSSNHSWLIFLSAVLLAFIWTKGCQAGSHEKRLLSFLLDKYNVLERPVANESEPVTISFGLTLQQIIDVDEKNQILTTNAWLNMDWNDYNLRWNPADFGGVKDVRIPPHRIWKPDVLMYNSADEGFDGTYPTNVVIRHNGSCSYVPPGILKSTCKIDITWFPFDDQHCRMKFGSWTYDGFMVDLLLRSEDGGDTSSFITNGEWELIGVPAKRNVQYYTCCPEPYVDITFTVHIRRRTLYYFFNLIVPCVLISSMALLGFTLPPDSGEKLTLGVKVLLSLTVFLNLVAEKTPSTSEALPIIGVTILLSLTVFLNLVAETLPQVSDAIPLLGTYFNCIMFMVASSVVLTVVVLNYHHRTADMHEMQPWVRTVFLLWLPWILRMSRPGKKITRKTILMNHRMKELELKERSSRSLLANVLDMDDDFRGARYSSAASSAANLAHGFPLPPSSSSYNHHSSSHHHTSGGHQQHAHHSSLGNMGMGGYVSRSGGMIAMDSDTDTSTSCLQAQRDLQAIIRELRFITTRIKKKEEEGDLIADWKFAAMVVDRFCLIIFTLFTVIATITVLLSAPHIIVQ